MTPTKSILHHETVVLSSYSQTVCNPCFNNRSSNSFNKVLTQFYCISSVTNLHANFRTTCKTLLTSWAATKYRVKQIILHQNHSRTGIHYFVNGNCYIKNGKKIMYNNEDTAAITITPIQECNRCWGNSACQITQPTKRALPGATNQWQAKFNTNSRLILLEWECTYNYNDGHSKR